MGGQACGCASLGRGLESGSSIGPDPNPLAQSGPILPLGFVPPISAVQLLIVLSMPLRVAKGKYNLPCPRLCHRQFPSLAWIWGRYVRMPNQAQGLNCTVADFCKQFSGQGQQGGHCRLLPQWL